MFSTTIAHKIFQTFCCQINYVVFMSPASQNMRHIVLFIMKLSCLFVVLSAVAVPATAQEDCSMDIFGLEVKDSSWDAIPLFLVNRDKSKL